MEDVFIKLGRRVLQAEGFISSEGERVPLSATDKLLYVYMKDKWDFHVKERRGVYFESHEMIAKMTNTARNTVGRFVNKMRDAGVIEYKAKKGGQFKNYRYLYIHPLTLYFKQEENKDSKITWDEQEMDIPDVLK